MLAVCLAWAPVPPPPPPYPHRQCPPPPYPQGSTRLAYPRFAWLIASCKSLAHPLHDIGLAHLATRAALIPTTHLAYPLYSIPASLIPSSGVVAGASAAALFPSVGGRTALRAPPQIPLSPQPHPIPSPYRSTRG